MFYLKLVLLASVLPAFSNAFSHKLSRTIAVTGATGKTGSLVVDELLARGDSVIAMVRNTEKANEILPTSNPLLKIVACDLTSEQDIISCVSAADAAIWCATGFSGGNQPPQSLWEKVKGLFGGKRDSPPSSPKSIDTVGISALTKAFDQCNQQDGLPKVVMLSSAGVTRPSWSDEKKAKLAGCADIPIVRLNPFGILNVKAESEEILRKSGVNYVIFRPTGLNDEWPAGSRPIFSQGDVAVGRINRKDVARILVDCTNTSEATGMTFEAFSIEGYSPSESISSSLSNLKKDSDGPLSEEEVQITFNILQQMLPGEKQDAAALAMGQTYEQLDQGQTGRLGVRGEEKIEETGLKPTV